MLWEVRISYKPGVLDAEGESTFSGLKALGFEEIEKVTTAKVFRIEGDLSRKDVEEMCKRLLANPISQDYEIIKVQES